ncbi:cell division protein ZapA [Flavobacteriaceae bacterium]|jgi:cell division protein ZapA (FtsZ GTPase activity inhibitor)|nr:cell division protein ZapA [Flavobacteriaceae bacterium]
MSEQLKIKLSIANRVYPLTIAPDQEEGLRLAAQKIETTVKKFEQSYSVQDKQDVLAMCALQFAAETEQTKINKNSLSETLEKRLLDLDARLEQHLNTNVL